MLKLCKGELPAPRVIVSTERRQISARLLDMRDATEMKAESVKLRGTVLTNQVWADVRIGATRIRVPVTFV